jgi:hypothetical protein
VRILKCQSAWRYIAFSFLQGFFVAFGLYVFLNNAAFVPQVLDSNLDRTAYLLLSFSVYIDLAKSVICIGGFALCTRLLDNHVRSIDRSIASWIVTLACYPPLFDLIDRSVGGLNRTYEWNQYLTADSVYYYAYAALLALFGILYASDMLVWGARFSNLAFRGLIADGPFALVRHPAYLTKCIYFWLVALPLFAPDLAGAMQQAAQLTFISLLYWVRSRLEDKHLRLHEEYRIYEGRRALDLVSHPRYREIPGRPKQLPP